MVTLAMMTPTETRPDGCEDQKNGQYRIFFITGLIIITNC